MFRTVSFAALVLSSVAGTALADGDPVKGEQVFRKCAACHQVGTNAKNRVGPFLTGVFGRTAGSVDGFRYSPAMSAAGEDGLIWDEDSLEAFLAAPRATLPGTKMAFPGIPKEDDREDLIAFLMTFP